MLSRAITSLTCPPSRNGASNLPTNGEGDACSYSRYQAMQWQSMCSKIACSALQAAHACPAARIESPNHKPQYIHGHICQDAHRASLLPTKMLHFVHMGCMGYPPSLHVREMPHGGCLSAADDGGPPTPAMVLARHTNDAPVCDCVRQPALPCWIGIFQRAYTGRLRTWLSWLSAPVRCRP
jgi:hypothetical protein